MKNCSLALFSLLLFFFIQVPSLFAQTNGELIEADSVRYFTEQELDSMGSMQGLDAKHGVTFYRVLYYTNRVDGSLDTASGALLLPNPDSCNGFPLLSYQHGTVLHDQRVPSNPSGEYLTGLIFGIDHYVVTMPDYLGMGVSEGLHPYHHWETQATSSIDLMRASREFIQSSHWITLNGEVFLTGYSQGGHATMSVHKYIEENGLLNEFDVTASAPLSGAYDLSGVQARKPQDSLYPSPGYYPYIIESYQDAYGNLYDSIEQVYETPYDSLVPIYLSGDSTLGDFNAALPNNLYYFLEDTLLDAFYQDTVNFSHPLRLDLADNDVYDWAPQRPVLMAYCSGDEQVFPDNSVLTRDTMVANGAPDVQAIDHGSNFGHGGCFYPAISTVLSWFDGKRSFCTAMSLEERERSKMIRILPNPTEERFRFKTPFDKGFQFEVVTLQGRTIWKGGATGPDLTGSIKGIDPGIYILRVRNNGEMHIRKWIISP